MTHQHSPPGRAGARAAAVVVLYVVVCTYYALRTQQRATWYRQARSGTSSAW